MNKEKVLELGELIKQISELIEQLAEQFGEAADLIEDLIYDRPEDQVRAGLKFTEFEKSVFETLLTNAEPLLTNGIHIAKKLTADSLPVFACKHWQFHCQENEDEACWSRGAEFLWVNTQNEIIAYVDASSKGKRFCSWKDIGKGGYYKNDEAIIPSLLMHWINFGGSQ